MQQYRHTMPVCVCCVKCETGSADMLAFHKLLWWVSLAMSWRNESKLDYVLCIEMKNKSIFGIDKVIIIPSASILLTSQAVFK